MALVLVFVLACAAFFGLYFGLGENLSSARLFQQGKQAAARGSYQQAIDLYKRGLAKAPQLASGYNLLGMAFRMRYEASGEQAAFDGEIDAFTRATKLAPADPVPLINLVVALYYSGRKSEGAGYLKKALALDPGHPDRATLEELIRTGQR